MLAAPGGEFKPIESWLLPTQRQPTFIDGLGENLYDGLVRAFARVLALLQVELVLLLVWARVQLV